MAKIPNLGIYLYLKLRKLQYISSLDVYLHLFIFYFTSTYSLLYLYQLS